jgi:hypothetical protein
MDCMVDESRASELQCELEDIELQIHNAITYLGGTISQSDSIRTLATVITLRKRRREITAELGILSAL